MAMRYFLLIFSLLLFTAINVFAQIESSTAPVKWERYRARNQKVSLIFPKLPTVVDASNPCAELEKRSYYTYADNTVYELVIVAKSESKPPDWCVEKQRFGKETFSSRLNELRNEKAGNLESTLTKFGLEVLKFEHAATSRWVVSDLTRDRWIELAIHGRENRKANEDRFLDSMDPTGSDGIDIGDGAKTTLGDPPAAATTTPEQKVTIAEVSSDQKAEVLTDSLRIVSNPRARYTEAARRANVAGSVLLKVTLLKDGSVGNVTPVRGLTHGLTEQAISASRRIVFLPKRVNGSPVSVVKTFEYSFSIY